MAKVKLTAAYWRRQAKYWQRMAQQLQQNCLVEQGLRAVNEVLYDTQLEWVKANHPQIYEQMITVFPGDDADEIFKLFG